MPFMNRAAVATLLGMAVAAMAITPACSHAAGLWNMPTSLRQCMGAGFGPGYHAPIAKGPWYKSTIERPGIVRLRNAPRPPMTNHYAGHKAVDFGHSTGYSTVPAMPASHSYYSEPSMPQYDRAMPNQAETTIFQAPAIPAPAPAASAAPRPEPVKKPAANQPPKKAEPASPSDSLKPDPLPLPPR